MKKIIFALLLLVLLASCGTKSKETTSTSKDSSIPYTSSSSPSSSLSQSIEKKTEYPASLSNFSNGDYSNFNGLYKSTANSYIIISADKIGYYSSKQETIGSVIANKSTYQSKTESAPFSQTYEFNQGQITFNFNDVANKINDIRIIDTNSTSSNFSFIAKLDPNNFTESSVPTYFKAFFGADAENYSFLPDKDGDTCIISVISNKILANGGSGTVGLYQVLPDGSFYLVTRDSTNNTYIRS